LLLFLTCHAFIDEDVVLTLLDAVALRLEPLNC